MVNVKLKYLGALNEEILRLEKLGTQMSKTKDYEKKEEYCKDLKWCREEKIKILTENPLDEVELTEEEYVMAKFYYYDGMTWEDAFSKMTVNLDLTVYDKWSDDEIDKCVNRLKKYITRKVQKYSKFYKK